MTEVETILIGQGFRKVEFKRAGKVSIFYEDSAGNVGGRSCTTCGTVKVATDFKKDKRNRGGLDGRCRSCDIARMKDYNADPIVKARQAEYQADPDNAERNRQRTREYKRNNPEREALSSARRRARKAALPDDWNAEQQAEALSRGCYLTGETDPSQLHADHIIPIASGHGGTTSKNIAYLRADLNISKSDRNLIGWYLDNRLYAVYL